MSRLRKSLSDNEVNSIVEELLDKTIRSVGPYSKNLIILTSDPELTDKYPQAKIILDTGEDLNEALNQVTTIIHSDSYFLVMPDLPCISSDSIGKIIHLSQHFQYVVVPTDDNGTAACILPKKYFTLNMFGPDSSVKILEQSQIDKLEISKIEIKVLNRDLDTFEDYEYWKRSLPHSIFNKN